MSEIDNFKDEELRNNRFLRREAGEGSSNGMSHHLLNLLVIREKIGDEIVYLGGFQSASDSLVDDYEKQIGMIVEYKVTHGIEEPALPIEE